MTLTDSVTNGEGQVSSYLKERKIVRYVQSKHIIPNGTSPKETERLEDKYIKDECVVTSATDRYLNQIYNRLLSDNNVSLSILLAPVTR